jgi:hypothetical protein
MWIFAFLSKGLTQAAVIPGSGENEAAASSKPADTETPYSPPWRIRWRLNAQNSIPFLAPMATVLISFAALVIIAVQAWIYNEQRKLMTSTLPIMVDQTKIMGTQTSISFSGQRAYVGVADLALDLNGGQITVLLENIGRVPADKIQVEVRETRQFAGASHGSINSFELFPGSLKMRVLVPLAHFDPKEVKSISARTEKLYISGTIKYDDGFGNPDITRFGFEYNPRPNEGWTARPQLIQNK